MGFNTRTERFKNSGSKHPGPGAYEAAVAKLPRQKASRGECQAGPKLCNAPSIPSHNNVFGYEETAGMGWSEVGGELVRQGNPGKVFAGEGKDQIGPGHYEIKRELRNKGTNWHASTAERDFAIRYNKLAENANLGPGSYEIERTASHPRIKHTTVYPGSKVIAEQRDEEESSSESESNDEVLEW